MEMIESHEFAESYPEGGGVERFWAAMGSDEEIFAGMLWGNEFEDGRFISMDFEEEGADSVGEDFGVTSGENAVAEDILEERWRSDFGAEFLMATGGDDDQGGPGFDPMMEGVIGGGIAGVECDEDIWGEGSGEVGDGSLGEVEVREADFESDAIGEIDEILADFDTDDFCLDVTILEEGGGGESEVAFACAHIEDAECGRCTERGGFDEMPEDFDEALNLVKFIVHPWPSGALG